jgi:hypothetical protein
LGERGRVRGWVPTELDNVKSWNYFSIRKGGKEKEVIKYGMGTNEHPSF